MKKMNKFMKVGLLAAVATITLTGCALLESWGKDIKENWAGIPVTVRTYDESSQVIDQVHGKSMNITRDERFDLTDSEGEVSKASKVLKITVGGKEMTHVGSSLVAAEDGLVDQFEEFSKTTNINNMSRSIPVMNKMVNGFKNNWSPESKVILIRSQNGTPLATYAGNSVRIEDTDVPSSTSLLIDGKRLFVYRCDYTIYDMDMFE